MTASEAVALTVSVAGRLVVVTGNGSAAAAASAALLDRGAEVRAVASPDRDVTPTLADLAARGAIELFRRRCTRAELDGAWLLYPRDDDPAENRRVRACADRMRIWSVERPTRLPGSDPAAGTVTLVGGGPGDPGLITVRGLRALEQADVVIHDRLAPLSLLADLSSSTMMIDVAKLPGGIAATQADINRQVIEHASRGLHVVRLKGGDAFVFGRGMEEVEACLAADIPVAVVPGVTSAVGIPELAGISLTQRGVSHGFTVMSGRLAAQSDRAASEWAAIARSGTTLVLMMAVDTLPSITANLLTAGMNPRTPATTVQDGGTPQQVVVTSVLDRIAADAAHIRPPAVTVIGAVARPVELPGPTSNTSGLGVPVPCSESEGSAP